MAVTRAWKVYGAEGHRQRKSFNTSRKYDWSTETRGTRRVEIECADKTGTYEYVIVRITRDTYEQCSHELSGQITDGIFENSRTGRVEEITEQERRR